MTPTRKEVEEFLGGELHPDIPIDETESWPPEEDSSGAKFELVGFIKGSFVLFKKSLAGRIIRYYIYAFGLGMPIPSPYQVVLTTWDHAADYSQIVYERAIDPDPDPFDRYLVSLPKESLPPPSGQPLRWDDLPTGSGVYPLSGGDSARLPWAT
jgi:hypothetical protein